MSEFFDETTRIVASEELDNVEKLRQLRRLLFGAIARNGYTVPSRDNIILVSDFDMRGLKSLSSVTFNKIRLAYLSRDSYAYRMELYRAAYVLRSLSKVKGADFLLKILDNLFKDSRIYGMDGLEPLLIMCIDGIALHHVNGDGSGAKIREDLIRIVREMRDSVRYSSSGVPINIKVPIMRINSYMALDLRADALRVLFDQYLRAIDLGNLIDLVGLVESVDNRKAMCNTPDLYDQNGEPLQSDVEKRENCNKRKEPGGEGDGVIKRGLGNLADIGCMLVSEQERKAVIAKLEAVHKCLSKADEVGNLPVLIPVLMGRVATFAAGVVAGLAANYIYESLGLSPNSETQRAEREAQQATREMQVEVAKQDTRINEISTDISNLQTDLDNLKNDQLPAARTDIINATTPEDRAKAEAVAQEILNKIKEKEDKLAKLKADKEAAEKKKQEAIKKAETANEKANKGDKPGIPVNEQRKLSKECTKALFGKHADQIDPRLFLDTLTNIRNYLNWRIGFSSMPNPDAPTPFGALEVPICGLDEQTTNNNAEGCNLPVLCVDSVPDANCSCTGKRKGIAQLSASLSVLACTSTRCADDRQQRNGAAALDGGGNNTVDNTQSGALVPVAVGHICICTETKAGAVPIPKPVPPTAVTIDTLFGDIPLSLEKIQTNPSEAVSRLLFMSDGKF